MGIIDKWNRAEIFSMSGEMANDREQAQGRELSRAHRTARELSPLFRLRITNC